jgi:hypothetical protein
VLVNHRANHQYALITNTSFANENIAGGLCTILNHFTCQPKAAKHEKNCILFFLAMQMAIFIWKLLKWISKEDNSNCSLITSPLRNWEKYIQKC